MSPDHVIEVDAIRKAYGPTIAADDISFTVRRGEIFGLIGPNGAGKTTTMECVEGLAHRIPAGSRCSGSTRSAIGGRCSSESGCNCRRRSYRNASKCGRRSHSGNRSTRRR